MFSPRPEAPPPAGSGPRAERRAGWVFALALTALAFLYFLTIPANHTEAEDAYWYAYDAREKPYHALFHQHHLLYLPVMRLLFTAGHFPDALGFMIGLDILCAVATVGLLYRWLRQGLQLDRSASVFACLFMAFSYGFWRYAVEAEVYLPAMVLMVLLAARVLRRGPVPPAVETWPGQAITAVLGAASVLMHAPLSAPLAIVTVPFYLLVKRRFRAFVVYGVVATVLVTSAYYVAFRVERDAHDPTMAPTPATFAGYLNGRMGSDSGPVSWTNLPKAVPGLGAAVVASNYLFAIPKTRDKLFAAFPTRDFAKEAFTARSYSIWLAYLGAALTVVLLGLIVYTAATRLDWRAARWRTLFAGPETLALFLWLASYGALVCMIEPENPENWICSLLPVAAIAALLVHFLYRDVARARLPWVFAALLLTQNLLCGFYIIHRPESDLRHHKGEWVLAHARAGDVVFTRDNDVFTRYLRYKSPAEIVNCNRDYGANTRAAIANHRPAAGGTRYLFLDVIEPPGHLRAAFPDMYDDLAGLRRELSPTLLPTGAEDVKIIP